MDKEELQPSTDREDVMELAKIIKHSGFNHNLISCQHMAIDILEAGYTKQPTEIEIDVEAIERIIDNHYQECFEAGDHVAEIKSKIYCIKNIAE